MADNQTLHGLVSLAANQHPTNTAVIFDDGEQVTMVTYGEMEEAAECIRKMLCSVGCGDQMVGLYYKPSIIVPPCILGILSAGASFAPIDPRALRDINEYFISSLCLPWVLLPESLEEKFIQTFGKRFKAQPTGDPLLVNNTCLRLVKLLTNQKDHHCSQSQSVSLAYAMHTSGTTGQPKIVRVPHQCIVPNITDLSNIFGITAEDIIFMASPLTFDPSIVEMFLALSQGATLVMVPDVLKMVPRRLLGVFIRNRVSVLQATPTLISNFGREALRQTVLSPATPVHVLAFGGETCPTLAEINHMRAAGNTKTTFYNLYGITEVSSWASCYRIDTEGQMDEESDSMESIPLGEPLLATTLEVRDDNDQIITEGEGQLYIGGDSRVCLLDGETWPVPFGRRVMRPSGDWVSITDRGLVFIGRHDDQVKRHGKRVSLSQVKERIQTLPGVESCEVILTPQDKLFIFCMMSSLTIQDKESLQGVLANVLPSHCRPDRVYFLETFPLTLHGKVDVRALLHDARELEGGERGVQGQSRDGRMQRETLELLWKRALSSSTEPLDTDLFIQHGGGDSFSAVQLVDDIESHTRQHLPNVLDVVLHETFEHVLKHLQSNVSEKNLGQTDDSAVSAGQQDLQKTQHSGDSVTSLIKPRILLAVGTQEIESTNIDSPLIETQPPKNKSSKPEDKWEEFDHQHHLKCRKLSNKDDINQTDDTVNEIKNEQSVLKSDSLLSRESDNLTPTEKPKRNGDLCASTTIPNCQVSSQNTFHDLPRAIYVIRRCSQWMRTNARKEHPTDLYHPLDGGESDKMAARSSLISHSGHIHFRQSWKYHTGKCVDASPLLVTNSQFDTVIYIGSHSHKFVAISMVTGKSLWITELGDRVESSACMSTSGSKVVVGCYDYSLYTLDADSGRIHWKFETNGPIKCSPVADHDSSLIYIGSHDQYLYALDIEERSCKWQLHCGGSSIFASPIIHYPSATVYVATLAGILLAIDKETGLKKWTFSCAKPVFSSPMVSLDSVIFGCVDGSLYCIGHNGKQLWSFSSNAPIFSSPCISPIIQSHSTLNISQRSIHHSDDSCVVFGSHDHNVYCLSLRTGELLWRHRMPSTVYASPFVFKNRKLSQMLSQNQHTGHELFSQKDCAQPCVRSESQNMGNHSQVPTQDLLQLSSPSIPQDSENKHGYLDSLFVAICSTEGSVMTIDLVSGEVIASCQLPGEVFSSPVVVGDRLVVGCRDDYVYCLEIC